MVPAYGIIFPSKSVDIKIFVNAHLPQSKWKAVKQQKYRLKTSRYNVIEQGVINNTHSISGKYQVMDNYYGIEKNNKIGIAKSIIGTVFV